MHLIFALVSLLGLSARQSKKCEQTTAVSTSWCVPPLLPSCLFRFCLPVRERSFLVIFSLSPAVFVFARTNLFSQIAKRIPPDSELARHAQGNSAARCVASVERQEWVGLPDPKRLGPCRGQGGSDAFQIWRSPGSKRPTISRLVFGFDGKCVGTDSHARWILRSGCGRDLRRNFISRRAPRYGECRRQRTRRGILPGSSDFAVSVRALPPSWFPLLPFTGCHTVATTARTDWPGGSRRPRAALTPSYP